MGDFNGGLILCQWKTSILKPDRYKNPKNSTPIDISPQKALKFKLNWYILFLFKKPEL